ncbi:MAG: arsenate reductase [Pseudomonadota bacterium]
MAQALRLHGIPHCATVKKARAWLASHGHEVEFHDFKKTPITLEQLERWEAALGWETLLKKTGTTWRSLPDEHKRDLSRAKVLQLLHEHPNLIRRPILELPTGGVLAGFVESQYQKALQSQD